MRSHKITMVSLVVISIAGSGALFAATAIADDDHGFRRHFEREDQHSIPFLESDTSKSPHRRPIALHHIIVGVQSLFGLTSKELSA